MNKTYISNRKTALLYIIENDIEAGLVLNGDQVKGIHNGHLGITGSYLHFKDNVPTLMNCNLNGNIETIKLLFKKMRLEKLKNILIILEIP